MMRREGFAEKRHRSPQPPCKCRRGFIPYRTRPKPWYELVLRIEWFQLACCVCFGAMGWCALFAATSHAMLGKPLGADGSLFGIGLLLCAMFWMFAGLSGWWSVAPIFENANEEDEEETWVK